MSVAINSPVELREPCLQHAQRGWGGDVPRQREARRSEEPVVFSLGALPTAMRPHQHQEIEQLGHGGCVAGGDDHLDDEQLAGVSYAPVAVL